MNIYEILVIILFGVILLVLGVTYLLHGIKLTKKNRNDKKAKKDAKKEEKQEPIKENAKTEQKPVPVGIIKEEKKEVVKPSLDIAPFKEPVAEQQVSTNEGKKSIQEEIKDLSPEMKKVLMSDLLKPKF